jgi:hypothetical protein
MILLVLMTAALVATIILAVPGSPAQARACPLDWYCHWVYYSDSTYTTVVGERVTGCPGDSYGWGVRSSHQEYTEFPC